MANLRVYTGTSIPMTETNHPSTWQNAGHSRKHRFCAQHTWSWSFQNVSNHHLDLGGSHNEVPYLNPQAFAVGFCGPSKRAQWHSSSRGSKGPQCLWLSHPVDKYESNMFTSLRTGLKKNTCLKQQLRVWETHGVFNAGIPMLNNSSHWTVHVGKP